MFSFHPTRRDLVIVLVVTTLLGLVLQFDFSLRFSDSNGSNSLLGFKVGFGGRQGDWDDGDDFGRSRTGAGGKDRWLQDVETGVKYAASEKVVGMGEVKAKWGEEGAPRTEVLAHAPGERFEFPTTLVSRPADSSGWTVFDSVYLFNGTWYIVVDNPSTIPLLRLMTSTGKEIWNDEESIQGR